MPALDHFPQEVTLVEVGPRDGLQNESQAISTPAKVAFINRLAETGLKKIEITSFVHPKIVPQLADADDVAKQAKPKKGVIFSALVPNLKGLERALHAGLKEIAVFTAASNTFVERNIHMTLEESIKIFREVIQTAEKSGVKTRGYVSTAFVCPYEGDVPKEKVRKVAERLLEIGAYGVSIGDTIGAASPRDVQRTIGYLLKKIPAGKVALHFHDTHGTALANVYAALELGISTFDTSAGGLGGCPFAPGASGNLATEDLLYMLDRMGIKTSVSLEKVFEATLIIANELKRDLTGRLWNRLKGKRLS